MGNATSGEVFVSPLPAEYHQHEATMPLVLSSCDSCCSAPCGRCCGKVKKLAKYTAMSFGTDRQQGKCDPFTLIGRGMFAAKTDPFRFMTPVEALPHCPVQFPLTLHPGATSVSTRLAYNAGFLSATNTALPFSMGASTTSEFLSLRPTSVMDVRLADVSYHPLERQRKRRDDDHRSTVVFARRATQPFTRGEAKTVPVQLELAVLSNEVGRTDPLEPLVSSVANESSPRLPSASMVSEEVTGRTSTGEAAGHCSQRQEFVASYCSPRKDTLCNYSTSRSFDLWMSLSSYKSKSWVHLADADLMGSNLFNIDSLQWTNQFRFTDTLRFILRAVFARSPLSDRPSEKASPLQGEDLEDELEIVIRCTYKAATVDVGASLNFLYEDEVYLASSAGAPTFVPQVQRGTPNSSSCSLTEHEIHGVRRNYHASSSDAERDYGADDISLPLDGIPPPLSGVRPVPFVISNRYKEVQPELDAPVFVLQSGAKESLGQTEETLQNLYSGADAEVRYADGFVFASVVRLRLRLHSVNEEERWGASCLTFSSDKDEDIVFDKSGSPMFIDWKIIEVQGGDPRELQRLLLESDVNVETLTQTTREGDLSPGGASTGSARRRRGAACFVRGNTGGLITDNALAASLDEWFDRVYSSDASRTDIEADQTGYMTAPLHDAYDEFQECGKAVCFVTTQAYRNLRVLAAVNSLPRTWDKSCMRQVALNRLPTLSRAYIGWTISRSVSLLKVFGYAAVDGCSQRWYRGQETITEDPFHLLASGLSVLIDLNGHEDPFHEHTLQLYNDCVGLTKGYDDHLGAQMEQYTSSCSFPSLEQVLLKFIDCSFHVLLDKRRFPESLGRNVPMVTLDASGFFYSCVERTPITLILHLYSYVSRHPQCQHPVWTASVRLSITHFVAVLTSLIAKQQVGAQDGSFCWSPFWTSHCLPIARAILTHIKECPELMDDPLPSFQEIGETLWRISENLCLALPLWHPRRVRVTVDAARFGSDWLLSRSSVVKRPQRAAALRDLALSLNRMMESSPTNLMERLAIAAAARVFLTASQEVGRVVHLIELHLNLVFLSKLLEHPEARKELLRELNEPCEDSETTTTTADDGSINDQKEYPGRQVLYSMSTRRQRPSSYNSLKASVVKLRSSQPQPALLSLFSKALLTNSLFSLRSRLCGARVEFMNFLEVTESNFVEDEPHTSTIAVEPDQLSTQERFLVDYCHDVGECSNTPRDASILDIVEWLKRFCWVFSFPGLQWNPGCEWISGDTVVTTVVQDPGSLSRTQVTDVVRDEIYHSSSVLGLRSLNITSSVPYFLVSDAVDGVRNHSGASRGISRTVATETLHRLIRHYGDAEV